jgi:uncharacterized protein (TIGR00369 family)
VNSRPLSWSDPAAVGAQALEADGMEVLRRIVAGELPSPPMGDLLGLRPLEIEHGRAVFACEPGRQHYNPLGTVHGGLVATLLDSALGCAVYSTLPAGWGFVTLDLSVSFVRALSATSGTIVCEGRIRHRGGTVATAAGDVMLEGSGTLVAHGSATCLLRELRAPAA